MAEEKASNASPTTSTPFREIFALYEATTAVEMDAWDPSKLDIAQQCACLKPQRIVNATERTKLLAELCQKQELQLQDVQDKAYLRIYIKHALKLYHRDATLTDCDKDHEKEEIQQWSYQQLFSSFLAFLIENGDQGLDDKNLTNVWGFAGYLRQYLKEDNYDAERFVEYHSNSDTANKGWGAFILTLMKKRFGFKVGLYAKAKKLCTQWARKVFEIAPKPDPDAEFQPKEPAPHIPNKFVTYIPQKLTPREVLWGKKWLWLNDEAGGQMQWRPYRPEDVKKLNKAWVKQEARVLIVDDTYRVDFDRSNDQSPAGFQFNNQQSNPGSRQVICAEWYTDSTDIHGLPIAAEPL